MGGLQVLDIHYTGYLNSKCTVRVLCEALHDAFPHLSATQHYKFYVMVFSTSPLINVIEFVPP